MPCMCDVLRGKMPDEENVRLHESKLQHCGHAPASQRAPRSVQAPNTEVRLSEGSVSAERLQEPMSPARAGWCL